jgi:UDP-N-acetylmuramate: L-alanyl-gamma-D-glutamyl-meso-diaminopimelate ligase
MNVHFIAIGGTAMHNLAIALKRKGYQVTGSDDEFFEPSLSRLKAEGLLPEEKGWHPETIDTHLDAVILGMHARIDNPELHRAQDLGIPVYSYPEYLLEQSKNKTRIVIGGSHGKTTITSMIIHAFRQNGIDCDYMVGAASDGLEDTVRLSENASFMVIEGDEYLTSPIDLRPKFHLYRPHIALISGIAWDHINVFPSFENYVDQFRIFCTLMEKGGALVYYSGDNVVSEIAEKANQGIRKIPYDVPKHEYADGKPVVFFSGNSYQLEVFGEHNLANLNGAMQVCLQLGVREEAFMEAMTSFAGARNRLQLLEETSDFVLYKDFAHSPSKAKATAEAVRQKYPHRKILACLELHTYSSLNKKFLSSYRGTLEAIDIPVVYFNPHAVALKKMPLLSAREIEEAFGHSRLVVFSDSEELKRFLEEQDWRQSVLLMMSSGDFNGINLQELASKLLH